MKANRAYRMIVTRSGAGPVFLADPHRIDHIELVEVDSGEVELFWDCTPEAARKLSRAIKTDLAQLDAEEFIARWRERQDVELI